MSSKTDEGQVEMHRAGRDGDGLRAFFCAHLYTVNHKLC